MLLLGCAARPSRAGEYVAAIDEAETAASNHARPDHPRRARVRRRTVASSQARPEKI